MTTVYRYQIYCETEGDWVTAWGTSPITTCPNNTAHIVTANSVSIVDSLSENTISYRSTPQLDSYGKLRIANQRTMMSFEQTYTSKPDIKFDTLTTGSGIRTYNNNESSSTLTCTTNASDSVIFQSRDYIVYQSGSSTLFLFTAIIGEQKTNCNQFIGYFDNRNGVYFTMNGSTGINVGYRSDVTGTVVDTLIPRSSWNQDKLDGSGPSGITVDFTKIQLWYLDFQWQGSGKIRWGIYKNGHVILIHTISFANTLISPYIAIPTLPVRFQISNIGTTASSTSMKAICVAVTLESTTDPSGFSFGQMSNIGPTPAANVLTPILSIRLKNTFHSQRNRIKMILKKVSLISTNANNVYSFSIVWNGTLTGGVWGDVSTIASGVEWDQSSTGITGGVTIESGLFNSTNSSNEFSQHNYLSYNGFPYGLNVNGTSSIILTLAVTRIQGNGSVIFGGLNWEEIS